MAGIRENVVEIGQQVSPDRYSTLAREAVLYDEVRTALVTVSANYSITENDHAIIVDTSGVTVTLPDAASVPNREYCVKNASSPAGDITLASNGGTIDAQVFITVATLESVVVKSDGTDWWVISGQASGGVAPGTSQFLGYFTNASKPDAGTWPVGTVTNYGYWCIVRDSSAASEEWICHKNSDDSYVWVLRSVAQY